MNKHNNTSTFNSNKTHTAHKRKQKKTHTQTTNQNKTNKNPKKKKQKTSRTKTKTKTNKPKKKKTPTTKQVGDYYLGAQISNENYESNKQDLINKRIIKKNGQTALTFERPLYPADSVQILEGLTHIIYGSGPTPDEDDQAFIPYHRFRSAMDVEFIPYKDSDANAVGLREVCAGPAKIACKRGLVCQLFSQEMIARGKEMQQSNFTDVNRSGFTSASSWGHGGRQKSNATTEFWNDMSNLDGKGVCIREGEEMMWKGWEESQNIKLIDAVREQTWTHVNKLRWGVSLYWNILDANKQRLSVSDYKSSAQYLEMALVASVGPGWLGIGWGTDGWMTGASSVIGWVDNGNKTNKLIKEYKLVEKLPWMIKDITETGDPDMQIESMDIVTQGHESALLITRPLVPTNGVAPITDQATTIIFAVGNTPKPEDDYFGYHRFRDSAKVRFLDASKQ